MEILFIDGVTINSRDIENSDFSSYTDVFCFVEKDNIIRNNKVRFLAIENCTELQVAMVIATRVGRLTIEGDNKITIISNGEWAEALYSVCNKFTLLKNCNKFLPSSSRSNSLFDDLTGISMVKSTAFSKREKEEVSFISKDIIRKLAESPTEEELYKVIDSMDDDTLDLLNNTEPEELEKEFYKNSEQMKRNMILDNEMSGYGNLSHNGVDSSIDSDFLRKLSETVHGYTSMLKASNKNGITFDKPI